MAVELPERTNRAEEDAREAQVALEVEVEGRRADQARAVGLEKKVSNSISSSTRFLFTPCSSPSDRGRSFFLSFTIYVKYGIP